MIKAPNLIAIITASVFSLLMVFVGLRLAPPDSSVEPVVTTVEAAEVVEAPLTVDELLRLVNEERAKVGVAPLVINDKLNQSAQYKAQDMFDNNYFAHKVPGTDRNNGLDYLDSIDEGLCRNVSENVSWNKYGNAPQSTMSSWINSPSHYKAMINPDYTYTGFGIAGDKIVEHFCIAN